ncbi:MAG: CinA family protein [Candidatus Adiutrix sp.]
MNHDYLAKAWGLAKNLSACPLQIGTAESLTGGLVAAAITSVPHSSDYFAGSVVAYSNQLKVELLGVPMDVILHHGAVSRECALAMALGLRRKLSLDVAIATTGIAGPTGATAQKPVGLVWLAVATPTASYACSHHFPGDRAAVTAQTVYTALNFVLDILANEGGPSFN